MLRSESTPSHIARLQLPLTRILPSECTPACLEASFGPVASTAVNFQSHVDQSEQVRAALPRGHSGASAASCGWR